MAIQRTDCLLLLTELQEQGEKVDEYIKKLMLSREIPAEVLKYIHSKRPIEIVKFYEFLRKRYNDKKSSLYINIMKEIDNPKKVVSTLSALLTQIILYSEKLESTSEKQMFLKCSRAENICTHLTEFFKLYDLTELIKLIKLIKADIKFMDILK